MPFSREIDRLIKLVLFGFALCAIAATYWAIWGPESVLTREDNPRIIEAQSRIDRGSLYDRDSKLLAKTITDQVPVTRRYYYESSFSALGYYSQRYGANGIESAFDQLLSGNTRLETDAFYRLQQTFLHQPQQGIDVKLTLDIDVQNALFQALQPYQGAGVVMDASSGNVIALVSNPTYDPNQLDAQWDTLIDRPDKPFFNRATQGQYQAGGMMQTPLLATALLTGQNLNTVTDGGNSPVKLDDITLRCALEPINSDITLTEAYAYACPYPFALLTRTMSEGTLRNIFNTFSAIQRVALGGFEQPIVVEATPTQDLNTSIIEESLGQGTITINPLGMASVTAAIVNEGNAPYPNILKASRTTPDDEWTPATVRRQTIPFITAESALQLTQLMRRNVEGNGTASSAYHENLTIGGHATRAIGGDNVQVWFIGYVTLSDGRQAVIAMVLENISNPTIVSTIAGDILATTFNQLN